MAGHFAVGFCGFDQVVQTCTGDTLTVTEEPGFLADDKGPNRILGGMGRKTRLLNTTKTSTSRTKGSKQPDELPESILLPPYFAYHKNKPDCESLLLITHFYWKV